MEKSGSQNILKNKWCITQSNKKIKRLSKDVIKSTLKKNKSHKHVEEENEGSKMKVKENLNLTPTIENENGINLKNYKKRRSMYEPLKASKYILEQETITSQDTNINTNSSKKGTTQEGKSNKNKKKKLHSSGEEYKPGMLSDSIQKKKYGCVIIPWDPSFGLDKTYKFPDIQNEGLPKLKINPLFDLSKRQEVTSKPLIDKNQCSIFVGNLPSDIRLLEIKKLFKKCGMIHHVKIKDRNKNVKLSDKVTHENQRHKSAIITFKQEESCSKALKMNGHVYKDCHIRVNKTSDSTKHGESGKTVFVGNLAFMAEDEDLWKAFASCGEIGEVRIVRDERSGKGKGYGYITFKEEEAVEKALELDGLSILKREIRVRQNETGTSTDPKAFIKRKKRNRNFKLRDSISNSDGNDDEQKKIKEDIPSKSEYQVEHKRKNRQKSKKKLIKVEENESV